MYRQGTLDSLCGVYAVINSTKAMCDQHGRRLTRGACKELFVELCNVLAGGGRLADALANGTTIRTFQQMTRAAHEWVADQQGLQLKSVRAFGSAPSGLADYWDRLVDHTEQYGNGSVLVGMSGKHNHWSCIRSISERNISLMDSDGIVSLRRDRCTVGEPTTRRQHVLWPTQTLLVSA